MYKVVLYSNLGAVYANVYFGLKLSVSLNLAFCLFFLFWSLVVNHCYDSPCQNNGTCHNQLENYTCSCVKEFTGQNCEGVF